MSRRSQPEDERILTWFQTAPITEVQALRRIGDILRGRGPAGTSEPVKRKGRPPGSKNKTTDQAAVEVPIG